MPEPANVLFVCTGNTCRSPMAEGLFRKAVAGKPWIVTGSAGVAAHPGSPASKETRAVLASHDASLDHFASRRVDDALLEQATHVFAMTESHLALLEHQFPQHAQKYHLLGEFAAEETEPYGHDVPDPIGCGQAAYREVADIMQTAIPRIIAMLEA